MEAAGTKLDQVHVLRQTFRPNEPFQAALAKLTDTGPHGPRPFSLFGSDERILSMQEWNDPENRAEIQEADRYMALMRNIHLPPGERVWVRDLSTKSKGMIALQLVMRPPSSRDFSQVLEGLHMIRGGYPRFADGFKTTRIYMNIPVNLLRSEEEVEKGLTDINNILGAQATRFYYQITPGPHISDQITRRPHPKATDEAVTEPEPQAS